MNNDDEMKFKISTKAIEHLGVRNYSTLPIALAELVANCWDADATKVSIDIDVEKRYVIIEDDGVGMTKEILRTRFLNIGEDRREAEENTATSLGRLPMGRKGIGKLAMFAIADTVEIATIAEDYKQAFRLDYRLLKTEGHEKYKVPILYKGKDGGQGTMGYPSSRTGTRCRLFNLKKKMTARTIEQVQYQLARRFGLLPCKTNEFTISINGNECDLAKHSYLKGLDYIRWYGGEIDRVRSHLQGDIKSDNLGKQCINSEEIRGWIGFVRKRSELGSSKGISIFVRGKMAKEDITRSLDKSGHSIHYIVGQINFDYLDDNSMPDLATTGREDFYADDEDADDKRLKELVDYIRVQMNEIEKVWIHR
nr:ATP-binding protein [Alphaproteobacteria bacterium]